MVNITEETYRGIAMDLRDIIGERNYYSGTIRTELGNLNCSLLVYRSRISFPEGECDQITDLVPIWWEFRTFGRNREVPNDFQFSKIKQHLV